MAKVFLHVYVDGRNGLTKIALCGGTRSITQKIVDRKIFDLAITAIKQIPPHQRMWVPSDKWWVVDNAAWSILKPFFESAPEIYHITLYSDYQVYYHFVRNLPPPYTNNSDQYIGSYVGSTDAESAVNFFGQQAFESTIAVQVETNTERKIFLDLMNLSSWQDFLKLDSVSAKKLYRAAALKCHPDRNNGDGSKMSVLNAIWSVYGPNNN